MAFAGTVAVVSALALVSCAGKATRQQASASGGGGSTGGGASASSRTATSTSGSVVSGSASAGIVTSGSTGSTTTGTGSGAGGTAGRGGAGGSSSTGGGGGIGGEAGAGGARPDCESQDVTGVGDCDAAFGVFFLGDRCGWVSGCSCEGDDCDDAYEDEFSCERANRGCLTGCAPQDAAFVGGCEPAPVYVFNGVECVPMTGCECVGEDCDAVYSAGGEAACQAAHAACADRALSCEQIETHYNDYVSHTACSDDYDCAFIYGDCGIGIGACYHVVNRQWSEAGLASLSRGWADQNCGGAVCDCPTPPPEAPVCAEGQCVLAL